MEKKITFSGEGQSLMSTMDKLRQKAKELSEGLLEDAIQSSKSSKEATKYIEDQIKAIERRNKLDAEGAKLTINENYGKNTEGYKSQLEKNKFKEQRDKELVSLNKETKEDSLQISLLKEIVNAIDKASLEEKIIAKRNTEELIDHSEEQEEINDSEEERKKGGISGGAGGFGFLSALFMGKKGGGDAEEDYEEEKDNEKDEDDEKKDKKGVDPAKLAERTTNATASAVSKQNELFMTAAALSIIPIVGQGLSTIVNQLMTEGENLQVAQKQLYATTGKDMDLGNQGMLSSGRAADLGYTRAQQMNFATSLAKNRGYATNGHINGSGGEFDSNVDLNSLALLATQKRYNIGESNILNMSRTQRFDKNGRGEFGDIQHLIETMGKAGAFGRKKDDFSSIEKLLEVQNSLIVQQTGVFESGNSDTVGNVMAAFQQIGGSFANPETMGARVGTVNNALAKPQGDFQQAFNYSILRDLNPNADIFELNKMQEKGIYQDGFLQKTIERIKQRGGGKTNQMMQLQSRTGLSFDQTQAFFEAFEKDPKMFNSLVQTEKQRLGKSEEQVITEGSDRTSIMQARNAAKDDLVANIGIELNEKLDNFLTTAVDEVREIVDKGFVQYSADKMGEAAEHIKETFTGLANDIKENIKEGLGEVLDKANPFHSE